MRRARVRLSVAVAAAFLFLAMPASEVCAIDSVIVASGRFAPGLVDIQLGIRVVNADFLGGISVPLEIRSLTPSGEILAVGLSYGERLSGPIVLPMSRTDQFVDTDGTVCPYQFATFVDGSKHSIASMPEAVRFQRITANPMDLLPPGRDVFGSLILTIDLGFNPGQVEIDTTCIDPSAPSNRFGLFDMNLTQVQAAFVKSTITLNSPPEVRDTSFVIVVNSTVNGFLPITDPDGDTLIYTEVLPAALGLSSVDPNTGAFSYTSMGTPGPDQFQYRANDGLIDSDVGVATVTIILPPPDTLHVSPAGSDLTGNGSRAAPYATIQHAMDLAFPGNVVYVWAGTYEGGIDFPPGMPLKVVSQSGPFVTTILGPGTGPIVNIDVGNPLDSIVLSGFTLRDNFAESPLCVTCVGGVYVASSCVASILNCIIRDNFGDDVGGIEFAGQGGVIADNWIMGNSTGGLGGAGGVYIYASANVIVVGNTITDNLGGSAGGPSGICIVDQSSIDRLDNNIIAFNTPGNGLQSQVPVAGKTLFNNLYFANDGGPQGIPLTQSWVFSDPLFRDRATDDLHLTCLSPARNAGRFSSLSSTPPRDIDGQTRTTAGFVDIGADQFYDADKQAIFTPSVSEGCVPLNVIFSNQSLCIDEQWRWTFGDGQSSTLKNPAHQYNAAGIYQVRLIASGASDADTTFDTIRVVTPISSDFSGSVQTGCVPFQVTFTATSNVPPDSISWDFGDGNFGSGNPVAHTYAIPGSRTVRMHATNLCGTDSTIKTDYIFANATPVVQMVSSFDNQTGAACNPYLVQFGYTSDRPIIAWNWDFGDNSQSTDSTPAHLYVEADTFSVRLIATGACGTVQVVRSNYIKLVARPEVVSAVATPGFTCGSATAIQFLADVQGQFISVFWLFGDGASAFGLSASHTYSTLGQYVPRFVVNSACGSDTLPLADSITVGSMPVAAFSVNADTGYEPFAAQFTDESSNLPTQWFWEFGDHGEATSQNPGHSYDAGVYDVSMVASNPCGIDSADSQRIVVGSFLPLVLDSLGTEGDTISYSVRVNSQVIGYDHIVHLSARITPFPLRGAMSFLFAPASGMPPFDATMRAVPTNDLSSGAYTIELKATDSARFDGPQPVSKTASFPLNFAGRSVVQTSPLAVVMDSTIIGLLTTRTLAVMNTSSPGEGLTLVLQPASISGPPFEIVSASGQTLLPGQQAIWTLGFAPTRKGDFNGTVRVRSDDPGKPDFLVPLTGRGIGEQIPPRVATALPLAGSEVTIDTAIVMNISEPLTLVPLDTVLSITSRRAGAAIPGALLFTPQQIRFRPNAWFWPDDTITARLRAIVTDTNGNRLDGNADGNEQGSPADDYVLSFQTGPGVFPGDANHDGFVNEADILPLGRFWKLEGPPRARAYTDFTVQAARSWPVDRNASHADADGSGRIDSADICPIAEFFDRDTVLPKAVVQNWVDVANAWSSDVIRSLLGALASCPSQGQGIQILKQFLSELEGTVPVPSEFSLDQNYPNPFNSATVIPYSLERSSDIRIEVFNILGGRVVTLLEQRREPGRYHAVWDGRGENGEGLASGLYFYRLTTDDFQKTRKMLLLK